MVEFVQLCFTTVNLPFTVALLLVLAYWLIFLFGAIGLDTLDIDLDADVDADLSIETDAEIGADIESDGYGGLMLPMLRYFNAGQVPLTVWVTSVVTFMWAGAILGTHYFNPTVGVGLACLMFIPNLLASLYLTKLATAPLRIVFKKAKQGVAAPITIVGKTCRITSGLVTTKSGQAELPREGAPITLNVRGKEGTIKKGTEVVVVDYDEEKNIYTVVPLNLEVPE